MIVYTYFIDNLGLLMNTLLKNWQQKGKDIKDGGNVLGTAKTEPKAFLMSKST